MIFDKNMSGEEERGESSGTVSMLLNTSCVDYYVLPVVLASLFSGGGGEDWILGQLMGVVPLEL
jgi:hypothetical protein